MAAAFSRSEQDCLLLSSCHGYGCPPIPVYTWGRRVLRRQNRLLTAGGRWHPAPREALTMHRASCRHGPALSRPRRGRHRPPARVPPSSALQPPHTQLPMDKEAPGAAWPFLPIPGHRPPTQDALSPGSEREGNHGRAKRRAHVEITVGPWETGQTSCGRRRSPGLGRMALC